jgi:hypothetical protein
MGWRAGKSKFSLIIVFLVPVLTRGQIKPPPDSSIHYADTLRKDSIRHAKDSTHYADTVRYHCSYSGTGAINNTNTVHSYLFSNTATFSAVKKSGTLNINSGWVYGSQQGSLTNNDFTATADVNLYKTIRHFYYWGLVNYNTSLSLQINHLIQGGLGIGYNLVDKKRAVLIISDGILYEKGDLEDILYGSSQGDVQQRDRYQMLRNSLRLKYRFVIDDKITLSGVEMVQNSFADIHNYILVLNANGSVRLYKWLSVTTAFAFNRFTRTGRENTLLTFGVTVTR